MNAPKDSMVHTSNNPLWFNNATTPFLGAILVTNIVVTNIVVTNVLVTNVLVTNIVVTTIGVGNAYDVVLRD